MTFNCIYLQIEQLHNTIFLLVFPLSMERMFQTCMLKGKNGKDRIGMQFVGFFIL